MSAFSSRRKRLRQWLGESNLDAVLVTSEPNVRYLFGFAGEGMGVVGEAAVLSTDRRYELEAAALPGRLKLELSPDGHLAGAVSRLRAAGAKRVGFESATTTYASYETLRDKLEGVELVPVKDAVEKLRVVKDKDELAIMRRAAAIMDAALTETLAKLRPGQTEREVALGLERRALLGGAEAIAFATIAAFGPSAAHCHAVPGGRALEKGFVAKFDCGARVDGYCSDITRTVIVGKADAKTRQIYNAVYSAQQAALRVVKAGVKAADVDAAAREVIAEQGYAKEFSHGLGHGVGLLVHELPRLGAGSEDVLKAGMAVTIEPGIYVEGWGGVRIEDTVVVTKTGYETLTHAPKQDPFD